MPFVKNSRTVPYAVHKIYGVVIDVGNYPQLLSFVQDVQILEKTVDSMTATVFVGLPGMGFSYDCLIEFRKDDFVRVSLLSGPFEKLEALWTFVKIDARHTRVDYFLDSKFKNRLVEMTAGAIFASQLNHSIAAFENHLRKL